MPAIAKCARKTRKQLKHRKFGGYMHKVERISNFELALCVAAGVSVSACADLVVTDVHHEPFIASQLQVKVTVKNEGWRSAPASTTRLEVKPAGSTTFTRSAVAQTPALASGQQIEFPIATLSPTELPASGSGQCAELLACADSADVVWEGWFWEGNNCRASTTCR